MKQIKEFNSYSSQTNMSVDEVKEAYSEIIQYEMISEMAAAELLTYAITCKNEGYPLSINYLTLGYQPKDSKFSFVSPNGSWYSLGYDPFIDSIALGKLRSKMKNKHRTDEVDNLMEKVYHQILVSLSPIAVAIEFRKVDFPFNWDDPWKFYREQKRILAVLESVGQEKFRYLIDLLDAYFFNKFHDFKLKEIQSKRGIYQYKKLHHFLYDSIEGIHAYEDEISALSSDLRRLNSFGEHELKNLVSSYI